MHSDKQPQLNIISLEDDAKVPDTFGLERFMEEVNILELEGYYFCPNRQLVGKRQGMLSLAQLTEQPVTIEVASPGQPGELAYKVLQAIFMKLSQQGFETNGKLLISRRELASLVGMSFGGKQSDELFRALQQLRKTSVTCSITVKERQGEKWKKERKVAVDFNILSRAYYETSERGKFARCLIQLDELVVKNLQNRHISYFNLEPMHGLDMVGMMLYKRFFRHMANIYREGMDKNRLVLEKDYEQVCTHWLGLKPRNKRVLIERQLGKRLEALKACRLLREWRIEERAHGQGFKIVGYAGSGFFADYENIYLRKAPAIQAPPEAPEPLLYLSDFHKQLGHNQEEFAAKEVNYVRDLLSRYGEAGVRDFMHFGLTEARKTNFDMQWFGALALYENKWQATHQRRAKVQERQALIAACSACTELGMLEFEDGTVGQCPHEPQKLSLIHSRKAIRGFQGA